MTGLQLLVFRISQFSSYFRRFSDEFQTLEEIRGTQRRLLIANDGFFDIEFLFASFVDDYRQKFDAITSIICRLKIACSIPRRLSWWWMERGKNCLKFFLIPSIYTHLFCFIITITIGHFARVRERVEFPVFSFDIVQYVSHHPIIRSHEIQIRTENEHQLSLNCVRFYSCLRSFIKNNTKKI